MEPQTAILMALDPGKPTINFMFNPSELTMEEKNEPQDNPGANNLDTGRPKVSFATKKSSKISMSGVIFDTFEDGNDVMVKYINAFKEGMTFIKAMKRPPVYRFVWGNQQHMARCFIENFTYKLTKFLPDGTPVRALVDISLREVEGQDVANLAAITPDRQTQTAGGGAVGGGIVAAGGTVQSLFNGLFF